jgi:excinuclease ABC subunit C
VLLKDDKSYPFLKLTNEPFPMLEFTRRVLKDGAQYFGPYPNPGVVRRVQELVAAVFPLRQNSGSPMVKRKKPCLRHHMGRCPAPCVGAADPVAYAATVAQVRAFLEGRVEETVALLETDMRAAAQRIDFELARTYRDRLEALKRMTGYESTVQSSGGEDLDFLGVAQAGDAAMVQLFQMRRGRVVGRDKRYLTGAANASVAEVLEPFMAEYYGMATHVPPLVLVPESDLHVPTWEAFLAQRAGARSRCGCRGAATRWRCSRWPNATPAPGSTPSWRSSRSAARRRASRSCRRCSGWRCRRGAWRASTSRT